MVNPNICIDCGKSFVMTASEKVRFAELVKNVTGFQMPRRCLDCRIKRREEKLSGNVGNQAPARVSVRENVLEKPPIPKPSIMVFPEPKPEAMPSAAKEEVRFILATKDFEDLVHGRPVVWQGVRVILADIGFKVMRDAIERAETERAKLVFKNGSA